MDLLYLGILAAAFGATYGLLVLCQRLSNERHGEHK